MSSSCTDCFRDQLRNAMKTMLHKNAPSNMYMRYVSLDSAGPAASTGGCSISSGAGMSTNARPAAPQGVCGWVRMAFTLLREKRG